MLKDLNIAMQFPVHIYSDSKSAIHFEVNPVHHERTKIIDRLFLYQKKASTKINHCQLYSYSKQPAHILSKGLRRVQHEPLLSKQGILDIFDSVAPSAASENELKR